MATTHPIHGDLSNGDAVSRNIALAVRRHKPRHQKTSSSSSSSSSITPGPFPAIDEALDMSATSDKNLAHPIPRCPQGLDLSSAAWAYRDRSPTSSTMSSSVLPDSATIYSMPMSPTYSTFTRATTPDIEGPERELTGTQGVQHVHTTAQSTRKHRKTSLSSLFGLLNHREIEDDQPSGREESQDSNGRATPSSKPLPPLPISTPRPLDNDDEESEAQDNVQPLLKQKFSFETDSDRLSRTSSVLTAEAPLVTVHLEDADDLLNYALQSNYGVELDDIGGPPTLLRHLASRFIQDIGRIAFTHPPTTQLTHTGSTSSRSTAAPSRTTTTTHSTLLPHKRKSHPSGRDDDDLTDDDASPPKKPRATPRRADDAPAPTAPLRLSCPFRKRNPSRFHVRAHHSCAMTYFPTFAELRQHIVKQHGRGGGAASAFSCDRCGTSFASRGALRDHGRLPRDAMCEVAEPDPEAGVDGPTAARLLSRKRAGGMPADAQWREVWRLVFPDDGDGDVRHWDFCPVIEHFELAGRFMEGLAGLEDSLRDKGLKASVLETIGDLYRNRLMQVVEQCVEEARARPYANRSGRRGETGGGGYVPATRTSVVSGRGGPRPDSGVDLDEGSSEGGFSSGIVSTYGSGLDGNGAGGGGLERSSSVATEVRVGAGGRVLMPLVEQGLEHSSSQVLPEEQYCFGGSMFDSGIGMQGQQVWPGVAQDTMAGLWPEAHGGPLATTIVPGQETLVLPPGLTYPGWGIDGHMYNSTWS